MASRQISPPGTHIVQQGEDMVSIAWAYGFGEWDQVWNHARNRALRDAHGSPKVLAPGAEVFIPDNPHTRFTFSVNQVHRVEVNPPTRRLEVRLGLVGGRPLANRPYVLFHRYAGDVSVEGTTDADGWVKHENLPVGLSRVWLVLREEQLRYRIELGTLDPVRGGDGPGVTGVQARLNNLGYFCGRVDGRLGPKTRAALQEFQREALHRDEPTGDPDDETLDALEREHGS